MLENTFIRFFKNLMVQVISKFSRDSFLYIQAILMRFWPSLELCPSFLCLLLFCAVFFVPDWSIQKIFFGICVCQSINTFLYLEDCLFSLLLWFSLVLWCIPQTLVLLRLNFWLITQMFLLFNPLRMMCQTLVMVLILFLIPPLVL